MTDHTPLKEAAEAATPGPWDVMEDETYCGGFGCTPDGCYGHSTGKGTWVDGPHIVEFFEGAGILIDEDLTEDEQAKLDKEAYDQACADAHFIALANPSKILELLAENEALREALEPFGELWMAARSSHKDEPDNLGFYGFNGTNITVGDLRRARALTEKLS